MGPVTTASTTPRRRCSTVHIDTSTSTTEHLPPPHTFLSALGVAAIGTAAASAREASQRSALYLRNLIGSEVHEHVAGRPMLAVCTSCGFPCRVPEKQRRPTTKSKRSTDQSKYWRTSPPR